MTPLPLLQSDANMARNKTGNLLGGSSGGTVSIPYTVHNTFTFSDCVIILCAFTIHHSLPSANRSHVSSLHISDWHCDSQHIWWWTIHKVVETSLNKLLFINQLSQQTDHVLIPHLKVCVQCLSVW